jgi:hypothetical protein
MRNNIFYKAPVGAPRRSHIRCKGQPRLESRTQRFGGNRRVVDLSDFRVLPSVTHLGTLRFKPGPQPAARARAVERSKLSGYLARGTSPADVESPRSKVGSAWPTFRERAERAVHQICRASRPTTTPSGAI